MTYRQTLLSISAFFGAVGISIIVLPGTVSGMMGAPLEEAISTACENYELAKQDLVQFVGAHTLSIGIFCWFLRSVEDRNLQVIILKGLSVACIPGLLAGTISSLGWLPMSVSVIALCILLAGLYGHTQRAKS